MTDDKALETEATELLRTLIRNACVNDGTLASGHEDRNADALESYFAGSGLSFERHTAAPGRESLITRIQGSDPKAPTLLLMGHTDVVPVNPSGWERDPFAADVVDGVVWGRGATDMLNITSTMAVATRRLAKSGFKPRGTLIYLAVADEEAGSIYGASYLTREKFDTVKADYVITESGGVPIPTASGIKLPVTVGEKGVNWRRLVVKGTPGHGSMPFRTDNALVTAAEVVRRVAVYQPKAIILDEWRSYVAELELPKELEAAVVRGIGLFVGSRSSTFRGHPHMSSTATPSGEPRDSRRANPAPGRWRSRESLYSRRDEDQAGARALSGTRRVV